MEEDDAFGSPKGLEIDSYQWIEETAQAEDISKSDPICHIKPPCPLRAFSQSVICFGDSKREVPLKGAKRNSD